MLFYILTSWNVIIKPLQTLKRSVTRSKKPYSAWKRSIYSSICLDIHMHLVLWNCWLEVSLDSSRFVPSVVRWKPLGGSASGAPNIFCTTMISAMEYFVLNKHHRESFQFWWWNISKQWKRDSSLKSIVQKTRFVLANNNLINSSLLVHLTKFSLLKIWTERKRKKRRYNR